MNKKSHWAILCELQEMNIHFCCGTGRLWNWKIVNNDFFCFGFGMYTGFLQLVTHDGMDGQLEIHNSWYIEKYVILKSSIYVAN
mmetsp:Transcript_31349/g.48065  ORF Transcript_31349/g.48065 Transcript_31349/m.48065 type:complete len:84 (-) Transcript_31349:1236-1487(-)